MDRGKREHLSAICREISDLPGTVRGGGLAENGSFLPRKRWSNVVKSHTHNHGYTLPDKSIFLHIYFTASYKHTCWN